jgi:CTD kinase subunit alpha
LPATNGAQPIATVNAPTAAAGAEAAPASANALGEIASENRLVSATSIDSVSTTAMDVDSQLKVKGKPGFRPIGQGSSSVKRFFPQDDDSEDPFVIEEGPPSGVSGSMQRVVSESGSATEQAGTAGSSLVPSPVLSQPPSVYEEVRRPPSIQPEQHPARERPPKSVAESAVSGSRSDKPGRLYSIMSQVGEGTFGKVYKARNTASGVYVALKRIRMETERDGFPVTAMREIKLLQSLSHENVVKLYEMMVSDGECFNVSNHVRT